MDRLKNAHDSHAHSLETLNLLYEYDDFMSNLKIIVDLGCGAGLDSKWWASLSDREEPPEPHNYKVYAIDTNIKQIEPSILEENPNIIPIESNFEYHHLTEKADFLWCHDAFQYAVKPLQTLANWNNMLNLNGMMIITIPQLQSYQYNRIVTRSISGCYYNHNVVSLMYMLAVSGFDCRDCFFIKNENSPWISAAVYKSQIADMDPAKTSWHDLGDKGLISDSAIASLSKHGYVRQEDLITRWLDKDFYLVRD